MPETRTAIDDLMVTAARCMTREVKLPDEIMDKLKAHARAAVLEMDEAADAALKDGFDDVIGGAELLLVQSAAILINRPYSQPTLECLHAARNLVAALRAEKSTPGTPQAEPSYWWTQGAME